MVSRKTLTSVALLLIPALAALFVWLSPLSFVPVPWPDDSAFYFVARDFFNWPPQWVMIPQAPFEPTYRIFNFNTMPLYPLLIGLGRFIGIDGSFLLKLWPLAAWALTGSLLALILVRKVRAPAWVALPVVLAFSLDPILRWASVLIRPESLVGLIGLLLVMGLTFGFPERLNARGFAWDPISALLALAAYAHFNAIHLLLPVLATFAFQPKRLLEIGAKTALYLTPWFALVLWHWPLFVKQMATQWGRLAIPNHWLSSVEGALRTLIPDMGSPVPWSPSLIWAAALIGGIIFLAAVTFIFSLVRNGLKKAGNEGAQNVKLLPASAWVLSSVWLWDKKPEVWFVYFIHLSSWCFAGLALAKLWEERQKRLIQPLFALTFAAISAGALIHAAADADQFLKLNASQSWRWSTYHAFVDCVDERLSKQYASKGAKSPDGVFRVWGPTFPDILIELSLRHPEWEFTRTNDFWNRADLAVAHGHDADAVVVTETLRQLEENISAPASDHPEITSVWMTWKDYFLNRLWVEPGWKPERYLCQRGRWQGFLFM